MLVVYERRVAVCDVKVAKVWVMCQWCVMSKLLRWGYVLVVYERRVAVRDVKVAKVLVMCQWCVHGVLQCVMSKLLRWVLCVGGV